MSFKSNLGQRQEVMRGMGSGNPVNQKMAGSNEPKVDANLASEKYTEAQIAELREKEGEIYEAISEGFKPSTKPPFDMSVIESIYEEAVEWKESKIDEEVEEEFIQSYDPDDPLYNPMTDLKRKRQIESALSPLSFEDMVFKGYTDQEVTLRENFKVVFRTVTTQQSLWIEQLMSDIREETMQYGRHWLSLKQIACSIQTINGRSIGPSLSNYTKASQKEDFYKALESRFEAITNMPSVLTDDLIVNHTWFSGRVRKLLGVGVGNKVGN